MTTTTAQLLSINISPGGIPKLPVEQASVTVAGLDGDGRAHAKHVSPARAITLFDEEILQQLRAEGYPVTAGILGENLTVCGLDVQRLAPGTRLRFSGGVEIELTEARKPCFVLDAVHSAVQEAVRGRCGFLARVCVEGILRTGESITVEETAT